MDKYPQSKSANQPLVAFAAFVIINRRLAFGHTNRRAFSFIGFHRSY